MSAPERRTAAPLAKGTAARTASNPTAEVHDKHSFDSALMDAVDGRLTAAVVTEIVDPEDSSRRRYRVRLFLGLPAAERAVLAAWDRGQRAEVVVCQLAAVRIGGDL